MSNINFANYGYSSSMNQVPSGLGKPTSVGTNGSASFFGTYDQTGNVSEHTEKKVIFSSNDIFTPPTTPSGSEIFESVVNIPYPQSFSDEFITPTPPPFPTPPPPPPSYAQPPASQQFGYGNVNRGGNFASDSVNIAKDSALSYSVPTVPLDGVGFRIAAASDIYNITGVYVPSTTSTIVYVPSGQIIDFSSKILPFMDVEGSVFADDTKVSTVSTVGIVINNVSYQRFSIDKQPTATGSGLDITVSTDNPLNIKNMVLVDLANNSPDGFSPAYGRVTKNYYIGKYPVTNSEYALYLNTVAQNDTEFVHYTPAKSSSEPNMSIGIHRTNTIPYEYRPVIYKEDKPVVGVTWLQAARYCNWLHRRVQTPNTTQTSTGVYDISQPLQTVSRSSNARYFLPNENEWYKAAYYGKDQGINVYTKYSTRSNNVPSKILSVDRFGNGPYRDLTDVGLFDRFRFDVIGDLRWVSILNSAADRWDKYLSHIEYSKVIDTDHHNGYRYIVKDQTRYSTLKTYFEQRFNRPWRGLFLSNFTLSTSTQNWIASCASTNAVLTGSSTVPLRFLPTSFIVNINLRFENDYTDKEWIDIITHELGHALGFGVYWENIDLTGELTPIASDYFMNRYPFIKTNIEYNRVAYGTESGFTRLYTPLEQSGGQGTAGSHWEDNYLQDGECFSPLNCAVDTPYVGIKDIMNGSYRRNSILSNITIANMVDLGYYSKDNTLAAEGDFQPIYSGVDPSTANANDDILGYCSRK